MKILFVYSGNKKNGMSPIVLSQANSLIHEGVHIEFFGIIGKGIKGYLKNVFKLKNLIKENNIDIIHAHYSLSGICASLTFCKIPIVVSLMGSDNQQNSIWNFFIYVFNKYRWNHTIVKSNKMKKNYKSVSIIPNGVDLQRFNEVDKILCRERISWDNNKKHVLFLSDPDRYEKNYKLAQESIELLQAMDIELHTIWDIPHEEVVNYLNACDVLVSTSLWEGSPNVIKESMACNCPIVSTNVGDVEWIFGNTEGCFISSFNKIDFSKKLKKALEFSDKKGHTSGRNRIKELKLDSKNVALKILKIYNEVYGHK